MYLLASYLWNHNCYVITEKDMPIVYKDSRGIHYCATLAGLDLKEVIYWTAMSGEIMDLIEYYPWNAGTIKEDPAIIFLPAILLKNIPEPNDKNVRHSVSCKLCEKE